MVTSYVNFYRTPIVDHAPRLKQLQKLIDIRIPLVIFATPDTHIALSSIVPSHMSHIRVVLLPNNFFLASFMYLTAAHSSARKLPTHRLEPKDTFDYMCYQHSKVEFIYQATVHNYFQTDYFAWVDYDMMKNFNVSTTLKHLYDNGMSPSSDIYFPGCWDYQRVHIESLCEKICWRFCGGFFLGSNEAIQHLHSLYLAHYENFLETYKTMVWDVNFWAYLEQEKGWKPIVYKANHDASLLENFPLRGYAKRLLSPPKMVEYVYPKIQNFNPSSASYIQWKDEQLLNIRYVDYTYLPSGHCTLQPDRKVRTLNLLARLSDDILCDFHEMEIVDQPNSSPELPIPDPNEQFQGVEDIRLYQHKGQLKFIATSVNYSGCASNRMIYGHYDISDYQLKNIRVIPSDKKEKNWVPLVSVTEPEKEYFVYSWNPVFQIAVLREEDGKMMLAHSHPTTLLFPYKQMIKGSSNIIFDSYVQSYVAIVHICEEKSLPKEYYHMLVWLDKDTYKPTAISKLFLFDVYGPEFCLSMKVTNEQYIFWISRFDRDPVTVYVDKGNLKLIQKIE